MPHLGLHVDDEVSRRELLAVEALRLLYVRARAVTAKAHHHLRRAFGKEDSLGPGVTLPVLQLKTINESYVPASSRFVLMVCRQHRAQELGTWQGRGPPLPLHTSQAVARLTAELTALAAQVGLPGGVI